MVHHPSWRIMRWTMVTRMLPSAFHARVGFLRQAAWSITVTMAKKSLCARLARMVNSGPNRMGTTPTLGNTASSHSPAFRVHSPLIIITTPFSKRGKPVFSRGARGVSNFILPKPFYYTFSKIPDSKQNIYFQKYFRI